MPSTIPPALLRWPLKACPAASIRRQSQSKIEAPLLALALIILLVDAWISLWLRGYWGLPRALWLGRAAVVVLAALIVQPLRAHADDAFDMKAALDTRLAYVVTGLSDVDDMSKAGLTGLGLALKARTSYEPQEPVGVDLDPGRFELLPASLLAEWTRANTAFLHVP